MIEHLYNKYKDNIVFVPLGTRCTSSAIIDGGLGKKLKTYPFDWIDINLNTILKFISIPPESTESYITEYFKKVDRTTLKHEEDGTWFPHDFPEKENVVTKYTRRFKRLFELFNSEKNIVFLTVFAHVNYDNIAVFEKIKKTLTTIIKGNFILITINLSDFEYEYLVDGHVNFHVPLKDSFDDFDKRIIEKIKLIVKE